MPDVLHKLGGHQANSKLFISPETHLMLALKHCLHGGSDTASPMQSVPLLWKIILFSTAVEKCDPTKGCVPPLVRSA